MRGRELLLGATQNRETFEQVVALFNRAIEIDPNYAQAFCGLAWAYVLDYTNQWSPESSRALGLARLCADQAVEKDSNEPLAHFVSALVAGRERNAERAVAEVNAALTLSPNLRRRAACSPASNSSPVGRSLRLRKWSAICGSILSSANKGFIFSAYLI
jgi:tetratricopeptide (TPR) repeat protein